ncbi:MAG TPA: DNA gyrase C-terminal beta-propeller domain-containing protein, partial [Terriglobales bacterium]|nr:DNA gyrase C-terminal beta-propeller domain-containing protein [Terriglobales bacterium]
RAVIVKELEEIKKNYGDARRTEIQDETAEIQLEDLIADEQVAVTVSHSGYFKRTPISTYRQQRRGGTGRTGMKTRDEEFVEHLFIASTHAYILIFTNTGRVYWLKVYEVPDVGAAGKGKHIGNLVALQPGESVRAMLECRDLEEEGKHVFFATRNGTVKKTPLKDFSNVMSRGIIAIGIDKDDELVHASVTDGNQIIFLASHEGQAIRFDEEDVRPMGRPAYGVRGMDLEKGDYIVGMAVTPKPGKAPVAPSPQQKVEEAAGKGNGKAENGKASGDASKGRDFSRADKGGTTTNARASVEAQGFSPANKGPKASGASAPEAEHPNLILSITDNGYGKRTQVDEYRLQSRGGKGVINVKTTSRNGKVVAILLVNEESEAMLISHYGKIIRIDTRQIREAGRSTQGVRLLQLEPGDKVAASCVIQEQEEEEGTLLQ